MKFIINDVKVDLIGFCSLNFYELEVLNKKDICFEARVVRF